MFTRFFVTTCMIGSSLFAADAGSPASIVAASFNATPSTVNASVASSSKASVTVPGVQNPSENGPVLYSQIIFASACVTFAGPICPMAQAVPVGAPCTCTYPNGVVLAGVAQ